MNSWRLRFGTVAAILAAFMGAAPLQAQTLLTRSRLVDAAEAGLPWLLQVDPDIRFEGRAEPHDVRVRPTFDLSMGLPQRLLVGGRYAPQSPVVPGSPDEWEAYGRFFPLTEMRGDPVDVALRAGANGAAESLDVEVAVARWFGPLRVVGTARGFTNGFGDDRRRGALAASAVLAPRPRSLPLAIAVDAVRPWSLAPDERPAWSGAVTMGLPYTTHSVSLFATNTRSGTLQGTSAGAPGTRWGIAFTALVPIGQLLGHVVPREIAMRAVSEVGPDVEPAVRTTIYRYAYPEGRIEIQRGQTIAWTNLDDVVHTVTADDRSWDSGAIRRGETWRARFDEPGTYPYHCGPHPFMKGVVLVR